MISAKGDGEFYLMAKLVFLTRVKIPTDFDDYDDERIGKKVESESKTTTTFSIWESLIDLLPLDHPTNFFD